MPDYNSVYDRRRLQVIDQLLPFASGSAVDIGCGDGTITAMVAARGYEVVGYDVDPKSVLVAAERHPELTFRNGSAQEAKEVGSRTLTVCLEVLEHLPFEAQAEFLEAIAASTRPGGTLMLSTPGRYSLLSLFQRGKMFHHYRQYDWWDPTHVGILSFRRLRRLIEEAGFQPLKWTGYCYAPTRICAPFPVSTSPIVRLGFDLLVTAARR